jgi:uncharacterized LabA/DUF88 family protein
LNFLTYGLTLTFIDFENIVKEAEQTYNSMVDFEKFKEAIELEYHNHKLKNCGIYAYSDFDTAIEGVQTKLYRLGIQARHVVTKASDREKRVNATDIELSLDIQSHIYENPLINHYIFLSGDGDLLHVMQRLRLKGKTIHLIAFEKVSQHIQSFADYTTIYDENAPFLNKITNRQKEKWAKELIANKDVGILLYHLNKLEKEKEFVGFSYFHRVITSKFDKTTMDEALTNAKKANLIISKSVQNPNDLKNPTSAIQINKDNPVALEILKQANYF